MHPYGQAKNKIKIKNIFIKYWVNVANNHVTDSSAWISDTFIMPLKDYL